MMARLVYTGIASLDGYIADTRGNFDWAAPDAEVHAFINDRERPVGTYLYGRRMYEVMSFWESQPERESTSTTEHPEHPELAAVGHEFAELWKAADKIVFSTTLDAVSTARTHLERRFDPATIRRLKASSSRDLSIGGPGLAAHALAAGLVDEVQLYVVPVTVGGGTRFLPDGTRFAAELLDERRFASGVVYLRYGVRY